MENSFKRGIQMLPNSSHLFVIAILMFSWFLTLSVEDNMFYTLNQSYINESIMSLFIGLLAWGFLVKRFQVEKKNLFLFTMAYILALAPFFSPPTILWILWSILMVFFKRFNFPVHEKSYDFHFEKGEENLNLRRNNANLIEITDVITMEQQNQNSELSISEMLTRREREIAALLIKGKTYRTIANELHVSENTVKTHVKNIYSKTGVNNRAELINLLLDTNVLYFESEKSV